MKQDAVTSRYLKIAKDLAYRISKGEFKEGHKMYGLSVLASEYHVSPETIRRSLRLLADMKVISIRPQSGTSVLSRDSAARYVASFEERADTQQLSRQLMAMMNEYSQLQQQIMQTMTALINSRETFLAAEDPLPNYRIQIPDASPVNGKSIGSLNFWQNTGCTIIALARGNKTILSPGPNAELYTGDVIILTGHPASIKNAEYFITTGESSCFLP